MGTLEIKFRAWDKVGKKMESVQEMFLSRNDTWVVNAHMVEDDTILMQYTGLKDKDGIEIYEGDLVRYLVDDTIRNNIWEVRSVDLVIYMLDRTYMTEEHMQVIGNIYENPELLKEANE